MPNELLDNNEATDCAGILGDVRLRPMRFGGHCFYVAKQVRGNPIDGDFTRREVGGIEIPQCYRVKTKDKKTGEERWSNEVDIHGCTAYVTVLAKGPAAGKPCGKHHAKLHKRPRCVEDSIKVGDTLICPQFDIMVGIEKSPICDYEYFIEEYVPIGIKQPEAIEK